jgi:hypothetical protein
MPKKFNNTAALVEIYIKENGEKISENTKKTYINIGHNIPFNVLTSPNYRN